MTNVKHRRGLSVCLALVGALLHTQSLRAEETAEDNLWGHSVVAVGVQVESQSESGFVVLGTAFVIQIVKGRALLATQLQVVAGLDEAWVRRGDGVLTAIDEAVAVDAKLDIAIVAVPASGLATLPIEARRRPPEDYEVTMVTAPLQYRHGVSSTIVTKGLLGTPIPPGALGAPLLADGKLVAMATLVMNNGEAMHSAVPISDILKTAKRGGTRRLQALRGGPRGRADAPVSAAVAALVAEQRDAGSAVRTPSGLISTRSIDAGITHFNVSLALLRQDKLPEAEVALERAVRANPYMADAYTNLALVRARRQSLEFALQAYQTACALEPRNVDYCTNLTLAYMNIGDIEAAQMHATMALRHAPQSAALRAVLGFALVSKKQDLPIAIEHLRFAVTHEPQLGWAHGALASALATRGELDAAIEHSAKAVAATPGNNRMLVNHAELLVLKARVSEAVEIYTRVVAKRPDDGTALERLGDLCLEAGRPAEAVAAFDKALRVRPSDPALERKAQAARQRSNKP